jgi:hypothetical protein
MRGDEFETGSISPTIVAKIVIDNIMVTPEISRRILRASWRSSKITWGGRM